MQHNLFELSNSITQSLHAASRNHSQIFGNPILNPSHTSVRKSVTDPSVSGLSKESSEQSEVKRINIMLLRTASFHEKSGSPKESPLKNLVNIRRKIQSNKGSFRVKGGNASGIDAGLFQQVNLNIKTHEAFDEAFEQANIGMNTAGPYCRADRGSVEYSQVTPSPVSRMSKGGHSVENPFERKHDIPSLI